MTRRVFVDTGAWLAIADSSDEHHASATKTYERLLKNQVALVTTILAVAETQIWLRRSRTGGHEKAMAFLKHVNESPRIKVVYPDARLEAEAKRILRQYADQDFSLADAISFAFMRQDGLTEAFAYDRHFAAAGFTLVVE